MRAAEPHWHFRPRLWPVLGTLAGCALTVSLGVWQLHRGHDKQALQDRYGEASEQPALKLSADSVAAASAIVSARAAGHYLPERQLLLDNQTHQRQPGYGVWTPLRLQDGGLIMVNRGWIPGGGARTALPLLPAPSGEVEVHGLWRSLPRPGLQVAVPGCVPAPAFPAIVNYPSAQELACALGEPVVAGELLLDAAQPGGYLREWNRVSEFPPQRHYAYAAQWFAFAATLLALFIKLNLKKVHD